MSETGKALVNYDKAWAEMADRQAAQEKLVGGTFLSTRGGKLAFGDEQMPGNQVCAIILDAVFENTYYGQKFDPDNAAAPICYAFGRDDSSEMAPHPSMQADTNYFIPQSYDCKSCPNNVYGSADTGKGKACQNRRRLAIIPAGYYKPKRGSRDFDLELFDDPKHFETADIAYLKLPVLSVKEFSKYVNQLQATLHRPTPAVITRISLEPDEKAQYKVHFELVEGVPDSLFQIIMARHDQAVNAIIQGYQKPEPRENAQPRGTLRGLRR
jgi:hypothetical protein